MADMSLGLATAPILYAAENAPEIKKIVKRRFKKEVSRDTPRYDPKLAVYLCTGVVVEVLVSFVGTGDVWCCCGAVVVAERGCLC